jgi:hypothetical protein
MTVLRIVLVGRGGGELQFGCSGAQLTLVVRQLPLQDGTLGGSPVDLSPREQASAMCCGPSRTCRCRKGTLRKRWMYLSPNPSRMEHSAK